MNSELSRSGQLELLEHIGHNADTYLENLSTDQRTGQTLLRLSANTAAMKGEAALRKGELDFALQHLKSAYEIHSKLLEENPDDSSLVDLTSNDLMGIAKVFDQQQKYDEAIEQCQQAYDLRTSNLRNSTIEDPQLIPRVTQCLSHIADLQKRKGEPGDALETYQRAIQLYSEALTKASKTSQAVLLSNLLKILPKQASLQLEQGDDRTARDTILTVFAYATQLSALGEDHALDSQVAKADANRFLGKIYLGMNDKTAALKFFRQEVPLRENISSNLAPQTPEYKTQLAESLALFATSKDLTLPEDRTVAINSYQDAIRSLERLPPSVKKDENIRARLADYREKIDLIYEMDE